ncbi:MAG: cofactor-independent phosphoglycerate mutase [Planctomycetota bacterium]
MKYAIVLPDGAADHPIDALDGKTPLDAAKTPNLDRLAQDGRLGTAATTPKGMPCGSDVCSMSLLGYDPLRYHTGRAPLEAAALGIDLGPEDWVFRVNLVTVLDGKMQDHSAGAISSAEGQRILKDFTPRMPLDQAELIPGVSYRNLLIDRSGRDYSELATHPPHDIPGDAIRKRLPIGGDHAPLLQQLIAESEILLADHEINTTRREMGEPPATHLWPWGQGRKPDMPSFESRFGVRGAMITAVDLLAGIAHLIGWDRLDVPGQTSYHDTDYAAAGHAGAAALDDYDLVCVHIEAPDEAAHAGDAQTKVDAIEAIDAKVLPPLIQRLQAEPDGYRILVMPDHYTRIDTRKHFPTPPPFLIAGHKMSSTIPRRFTEADAATADLRVAYGHELMEFFLKSGMK